MKLIWLTAAFVLLLMPVCAAQDVTVCLPNSDHPSAVALDPFTGMHFEEIYGKPKVSSPPANSVAHDPRYPGVYDTWRFRYRCDPEWQVIEGWPTRESCEAGRKRFLAVNPDQQVTPCAYYTSGNTEPLEGYRYPTFKE
jgi:hypothetical protein